MENIIKQSIDGRKKAIFNSYNITDKGILDKIEDLFNRINEFGESFTDINEFETEFAKSSLNKEYTDIFDEIAKKDIDVNKPSVGEIAAERAIDGVKNRVIPSHAVRADERDQAMRDMPIVGEAINVREKIGFFSKFRKKNK